jgi:Holliday junction resolvase RusA-like endonuclease
VTPPYTFIVPGDPVAKARPRLNRKSGHVYTPSRTQRFEDRVAFCAIEAKVPRFEGPVRVEIQAEWEWPRAKWRRRTPRQWEFRSNGPDIDNIAKAVLDGLKVCFNDRQVASLVCVKIYAEQGAPARTVVTVAAIG